MGFQRHAEILCVAPEPVKSMTTYEFLKVFDMPVATRVVEAFECFSDGRIHYHGLAMAGTALSALGWFIELYSYDGNNNPSAPGVQTSGFGVIWNNRASVTYT